MSALALVTTETVALGIEQKFVVCNKDVCPSEEEGNTYLSTKLNLEYSCIYNLYQ